jgi:hypothetical protein
VGAAIVMGVIGWFGGRAALSRAVSSANPPTRLVLKAQNFAGGGGVFRQVAISANGDELLYSYKSPDGRLLVARQPLDAESPTPMSETRAGLSDMEWSPDGRTFIYSADGHVYRQPIGGGAAEELPIASFETIDAKGQVWYRTAAGEVGYLGADNAPVRVAKLSGERVQKILSDGAAILVGNAVQSVASGPMRIADLKTGATLLGVANDVVAATYSSGYLVYLQQSGALEAAGYDVGSHRLTGAPVQLASGIMKVMRSAQFSVSRNGTLALVPQGASSLALVDREGRTRATFEGSGAYHGPKFSHDGTRISYDLSTTEGRDGWVLDLATRTPSRVTFDKDGHDLIWSSDGKSVTYLSARSGTLGIYRKRADGTTTSDSLFASVKVGAPGPWLKDGSALLSVAENLGNGTGLDIGILRNGGRGPFETILATPFVEAYVALSPDERWMAFASNQSGHSEVFVRPFGRDGDQVQLSNDGGSEPVWSRDGTEIFYRTAEKDVPVLAVATVSAAPAFHVVARTSLFRLTDVDPVAPHAGYDVSPDGKTLALIRRAPNNGDIVIIQNLPALVKKLQGATAAAH